jgi:uncharacterized protein YebE (UPF0316 family)
MTEFYQSPLFHYVVMPLLIFICRVCDVTLGTLRNLFLAKGIKSIVPFIGFLEVLIWTIAVSQVLEHLDNLLSYTAFALGYATGIYVGIKMDEKLGLGLQLFRIVVIQQSQKLLDALQQLNIGYTIVNGEGSQGPVKVIYLIIKRTYFDQVCNLIHNHNPDAFYTVEDVKDAYKGVFPPAGGNQTLFYLRRLFPLSNK